MPEQQTHTAGPNHAPCPHCGGMGEAAPAAEDEFPYHECRYGGEKRSRGDQIWRCGVLGWLCKRCGQDRADRRTLAHDVALGRLERCQDDIELMRDQIGAANRHIKAINDAWADQLERIGGIEKRLTAVEVTLATAREEGRLASHDALWARVERVGPRPREDYAPTKSDRRETLEEPTRHRVDDVERSLECQIEVLRDGSGERMAAMEKRLTAAEKAQETFAFDTSRHLKALTQERADLQQRMTAVETSVASPQGHHDQIWDRLHALEASTDNVQQVLDENGIGHKP